MLTIQAITDEGECCSCCGRTNLKVYVWILDSETQECNPYGTTCAGRVMGWGNLTQKTAENRARRELEARKEALRAADIKAGRVVLFNESGVCEWILPGTEQVFRNQGKATANLVQARKERKTPMEVSTFLRAMHEACDKTRAVIMERNRLYPHW